MSSLIVFGWSIAIGILIMGIYLSRKPWPDENILKINS